MQHSNHSIMMSGRFAKAAVSAASRRFLHHGGSVGGTLRRKKSIPLSSLTQGSTLAIRSGRDAPLSVRIVPGWRDDGRLTLRESTRGGDETDLRVVEEEGGSKTSMGRVEKHVSVTVDLVRNLVLSRPVQPHNVVEGGAWETYDVDDGGDEGILSPSHTVLVAEVPEKCNVTCHISHPGGGGAQGTDVGRGGGDVIVEGKLEGDADLRTDAVSGCIAVDKLRGHQVSLMVQDGHVHVTKAIEARDVHVHASARGRVRAKLINGSNVSIEVGSVSFGGDEEGDGRTLPSPPSSIGRGGKLDDDDGLAAIDVSSIYASASGDGAHLLVASAGGGAGASMTSNVRVKSNHGHLSIRTAIDAGALAYKDKFGNVIPVVDLGGVNGSCDVSVDIAGGDNGELRARSRLGSNGSGSDGVGPMAARVHVDSLSPATVSVVTADRGDVSVTLDRKIEADVRLLSCPLVASLESDVIISEDEDEIHDALAAHDEEVSGLLEHLVGDKGDDGSKEGCPATLQPREDRFVSIETDSFDRREFLSSDGQSLRHVEYVDGAVKNKSHEPDSRFDVRTKGPQHHLSGRGQGKINIEGAATQALKAFTVDGRDSGIDDEEEISPPPLLAVATSGRIQLETVSWFGAIARRYGMEEGGRDLGRQAQRKPRLQ